MYHIGEFRKESYTYIASTRGTKILREAYAVLLPVNAGTASNFHTAREERLKERQGRGEFLI
jgi:hypothetical protein